MRILIEPSDYVLRNAGDMAMLEVAATRLSGLWPEARIQVLSDTPEELPAYGPNVEPLSAGGRWIWLTESLPGARLWRRLPRRFAGRRGAAERRLRHRRPELAAGLLRYKLRRSPQRKRDLDVFLEAVREADLVVVAGMGGITDAFPEYAHDVLDTLGLAMRWGAYTAMVGQGIGPIEDARLRTRARQILPRVNLITLREGLAGKPLLLDLGVSAERIVTAGDEAIEMAYEQRADPLGDHLGVNVRASSYSGVDDQTCAQVRAGLLEAARRLGAPAIPVPISRVQGEEDARAIARLLEGYERVTEADTQVSGVDGVVRRVQRCRVVVTGSYHAGVFALSMGVSVVAIARSGYYVSKFQGLADQFGAGCNVVLLRGEESVSELAKTIEDAWASAERARPQLLKAAEDQIRQSRGAYLRLYSEVKGFG